MLRTNEYHYVLKEMRKDVLTSAPSFKNSSAYRAPRPEAPAVIKTDFPFMSFSAIFNWLLQVLYQR